MAYEKDNVKTPCDRLTQGDRYTLRNQALISAIQSSRDVLVRAQPNQFENSITSPFVATIQADRRNTVGQDSEESWVSAKLHLDPLLQLNSSTFSTSSDRSVEGGDSEGQEVIVTSQCQLLTLSDGAHYVLEVSADDSEQAAVREAQEVARVSFREAHEAKTQFLAYISHELRTPMTAVPGLSEMLKTHSDDAGYQDKVATIFRNGEHLLTLLNDILDLSKLETGKMEIAREAVSVPQLLADIQSLIGGRAEAEGVPVEFKVTTKVPSFVTGDQVRICQILVNLIGNAIKFTDVGTVRVLTDLTETVPPEIDASHCLRNQVIDTGIGMTEPQLGCLFQPFS